MSGNFSNEQPFQFHPTPNATQHFTELPAESHSVENLSTQPQTQVAPSFDYIRYLLRYKWILIGSVLVGLTAGYLAYESMGPQYEARIRILVSKKAEVRLRSDDTQTFGERAEHITLIKSPLIVGQAVEKHGLNQLETLRNSSTPVEDVICHLKVERIAGEDRSFLNIFDIKYLSKTSYRIT